MRLPKHSYAFVDGSFNHKTNVYGCGGFLIDQNGIKHIIQASGSDPKWAKLKNIAGEILGAKEAIKLAKKLNMTQLKIYFDYFGIGAWPLGIWAAKTAETKSYVDFVKNVSADGLFIAFEHVKGHSGVPGNEEADRLAREAVGLAIKKVKEVAA